MSEQEEVGVIVLKIREIVLVLGVRSFLGSDLVFRVRPCIVHQLVKSDPGDYSTISRIASRIEKERMSKDKI